jgi:hypothetical protein
VPDKVSTSIAALRAGIGENQMMAYLVEMAAQSPADKNEWVSPASASLAF